MSGSLITEAETGGIALRFGDARAMVKMVSMIGEREGFRAARRGIGGGSEALGVGQDLVVAVRGVNCLRICRR